MRAWLCKIICGKSKAASEPQERAFEDDTEQKINSIKRRIAALESSIGRRKQSNQNPSAPTKHLVEKNPRPKTDHLRSSLEKQSKNSELDAIKAKLMGKK